ncbi:MAG: DUF1573 domain-containing protein [Bacteroidales bacterium]|nr:DUF1573 domain-containing protein [Bacteroidales bacterium]
MVRYYLFIGFLFFGVLGCKQKGNQQLPSNVVNNTASAENNSDKKPIISFEKTEHDFGDIMEGEIVEYNFKFTNTGNADLIISGQRASCGCTVSDYPRNPIKPGESSYIKVTFNSEGRVGKNYKTVTLSTNCEPSEVVLTIKSNVIKP